MKTKDCFVPHMFQKLLFHSLFSSFGFALADMADALVLGRKMGETGLAAISLCLPVFMVINFFMDGFGIGGSVHYSKLLGMGKKEAAISCFNRIWMSVLVIGLLIGCVGNFMAPQVLALLGTTPQDGALYTACETYMRIITAGAPVLMLNIVFGNFLRNDNNAGLAAMGLFVGSTLDVVLNIVFVLGFDWGTAGAACATVTGSLAALCCYARGLVFGKRNLLKAELVKPDVREMAVCFSTGFSTSVMHLFQLLFFLLVNRILMNLSGEGGVAVFDIVYNASFFVIYIYNGTAEAMQPLVSTFTGENSKEDCTHVLQLARKYGLLIGGVVTMIVFVFAGQVTAIFGLSEALRPLGIHALRIYCVGFAFAGWNILWENYFQAREEGKKSFTMAVIRGFLVLLPCVYAASFWGIRWIWLFFPVKECLSLLLFGGYLKIQKRKETDFDKKRIFRKTITREDQDIAQLLAESEDFCENWAMNPKQKYFVTLIIEEVCMSIIRNALNEVPDGRIRVTLQALEEGDFMLHILDNAVVFNPFSFKAGKMEENKNFDIDEISMLLIQENSKKFMYRECQGFNSLVIHI